MTIITSVRTLLCYYKSSGVIIGRFYEFDTQNMQTRYRYTEYSDEISIYNIRPSINIQNMTKKYRYTEHSEVISMYRIW